MCIHHNFYTYGSVSVPACGGRGRTWSAARWCSCRCTSTWPPANLSCMTTAWPSRTAAGCIYICMYIYMLYTCKNIYSALLHIAFRRQFFNQVSNVTYLNIFILLRNMLSRSVHINIVTYLCECAYICQELLPVAGGRNAGPDCCACVQVLELDACNAKARFRCAKALWQQGEVADSQRELQEVPAENRTKEATAQDMWLLAL